MASPSNLRERLQRSFDLAREAAGFKVANSHLQRLRAKRQKRIRLEKRRWDWEEDWVSRSERPYIQFEKDDPHYTQPVDTTRINHYDWMSKHVAHELGNGESLWPIAVLLSSHHLKSKRFAEEYDIKYWIHCRGELNVRRTHAMSRLVIIGNVDSRPDLADIMTTAVERDLIIEYVPDVDHMALPEKELRELKKGTRR